MGWLSRIFGKNKMYNEFEDGAITDELNIGINGIADIESGGELSDRLRKIRDNRINVIVRLKGVEYDVKYTFRPSSGKEREADVKNCGDNYLTTDDGIDPIGMIESLRSSRVILVGIGVYTKEGETGFLKERDCLIRTIWDQVLNKYSDAVGCRLSWDILFFAFSDCDIESLMQEYGSILKSFPNDLLETHCVFREAVGRPDEVLVDLSDLLYDLSSKRTFGVADDVSYRLIDGNRRIFQMYQ